MGQIVNMGTLRELTEAEQNAYLAPFPKRASRRARALSRAGADHAGASLRRREQGRLGVLGKFEKPFLTAFSDGDPVTKGGERVFQERVPGAKGRKHVTIAGGGHFLQEDKPAEIVAVLDNFIKETA